MKNQIYRINVGTTEEKPPKVSDRATSTKNGLVKEQCNDSDLLLRALVDLLEVLLVLLIPRQEVRKRVLERADLPLRLPDLRVQLIPGPLHLFLLLRRLQDVVGLRVLGVVRFLGLRDSGLVPEVLIREITTPNEGGGGRGGVVLSAYCPIDNRKPKRTF